MIPGFSCDINTHRKQRGAEKTHRTLAWGVLGLASDGYRFSLLTLLFSGVFAIIKPQPRIKFRLDL